MRVIWSAVLGTAFHRRGETGASKLLLKSKAVPSTALQNEA